MATVPVIKVSELNGAQLDYWVAKALDATAPKIEDWGGLTGVCVAQVDSFERVPFRPSSVWSDGGPIIEREHIDIEHESDIECSAYMQTNKAIRQYGPTPLVAAMRAFVASKFGEEVPAMTQSQNFDTVPPVAPS